MFKNRDQPGHDFYNKIFFNEHTEILFPFWGWRITQKFQKLRDLQNLFFERDKKNRGYLLFAKFRSSEVQKLIKHV